MKNSIDSIQICVSRSNSSHDHHRQYKMSVFSKSDHSSDKCKSCITADQRKKFFVEVKLCFNCVSPRHTGNGDIQVIPFWCETPHKSMQLRKWWECCCVERMYSSNRRANSSSATPVELKGRYLLNSHFSHLGVFTCFCFVLVESTSWTVCPGMECTSP